MTMGGGGERLGKGFLAEVETEKKLASETKIKIRAEWAEGNWGSWKKMRWG